MWKLILKTWYQETPDEYYDEEIYYGELNEVTNFLNENCDYLEDWFPIVDIKIERVKSEEEFEKGLKENKKWNVLKNDSHSS